MHPSVGNQAILSAPPGVVARVHDKAFAHEVAVERNLLPESLRELMLVLSPETLLDPEAIGSFRSQYGIWYRSSDIPPAR